MKIALIGAGGMSRALGGKWRDRHELFVGGRDVAKATDLAWTLGGRSGAIDEAVAFADVVVLALPSEALGEAIESAGGAKAFVGKIVVDITNPVDLETFVSNRDGGGSNTEALEIALPKAHLAKAFNMAHTSVWASPDMTFGGRRLVCLYAAAVGAAGPVATLIADTGAEPLHIGDNRHAYQLEAAAAILIKFLFAGRSFATVLNLIQPESEPPVSA